MSDIAIHLRNVSKTFEIYKRPSDRLKQIIWGKRQKFYEEFQALRNIDLDIYRGETVGVVGRNGAGKSTLLQIICGTMSHSTGQVKTSGRIVALTLGSGFNPEFSGHENIFMNGTILGLTRKEIAAKYDSILEFADIGRFIHRPVKCYSSGMKSRLAFAVAIQVDPDILIIDETLSVGDEAFRRKCFARLEELRQQGKTILFVSHAAGQIVSLCDRAILIDSGEKLLDGFPRVVMNYYHQLMSATADQALEVRNQIIEIAPNVAAESLLPKQQADSSSAQLSADPKQKLTHQQKRNNKSARNSSVDGATDLFDPNLKPKSTVAHAGDEAEISNVQILNQQGNLVNVLRFGQQYTCRYSVKVKELVDELYCGISIKTTNGIQISGVLSQSIFHVAAGSILDVSFDFHAILKPGNYFLNVKVMGKENGHQRILHRIFDATMFRIQPISNKSFQGYVDISNQTVGRISIFDDLEAFSID